MTLHSLLLMLAGGILSIVVRLVGIHLSHLRHRSVDEVGDCHVKPDHELIEELYDPAHEQSVSGRFRWGQRIRLEKLLQQLEIQRSNARIDMQWGNTEWHDMIGGASEVYGPEAHNEPWWREWLAGNVSLRQSATILYVALTMRLAVLWLRGLFWRFLPAPRLASMRSTRMVNTVVRAAQLKIWLGSLVRPKEWTALSAFNFNALLQTREIDYPQAYAQLKAAVRVAGRAHGEDISEYIVSKM
jgi:hypothetical protein